MKCAPPRLVILMIFHIILLFSVMKVKDGLGDFENGDPWKLWVLSTVSKSCLDTKECVESGLFVCGSERERHWKLQYFKYSFLIELGIMICFGTPVHCPSEFDLSQEYLLCVLCTHKYNCHTTEHEVKGCINHRPSRCS